MNRRLLHLFLVAGIVLAFFGCTKKNSDQACLHEVTMNLDKGNYNAVLGSSCANDMQKGAAYFGLAGFDVTRVINSLSKTGSSDTTSQSDLNVYMTDLVGNPNETSLSYMDYAVSAYSNVTSTSPTGQYTEDNYKDAQFYISMVDAVKSLSLVKLVLPNLNFSCDANGNSVPDDADASSCALIASAIISEGATSLSCTASAGSSYTRTGDLTLTSVTTGTVVPGTYSGLIISIMPSSSSTATTLGCSATPPNPDGMTYHKLLYKDASGNYWAATTNADICTDNVTGDQWPCPVIQIDQTGNAGPVDFVTTLNQTITSSVNALGASLSSSITGSVSDVQQAVNDVQAQACCGCTTTPCPVCTTMCTSASLADYLQTLK